MSQTVEGTEHRAFIKLLCLPKAVIISIIDYNGRLVDIVQLDAAMQSSTVLAGPWREAIKGTRPLTFNSRRYTRVEEIRWVLKREADLKNFELSMPGIGGMTSLGWVVREGHTDIAEAIVACNLPKDENQNVSNVTSTVQYSSSLNEKMRLRNESGTGWLQKAPIHLAVENEMHGRETVAMLIRYGADPTIRDGKDFTPLILALSNQNYEVAELLVDIAPDGCVSLNTRDGSGEELSPLHWVCASGRLPLIEKLINKGANVNPDMQGGRSPFFTACENLHIEAAEILIKHGAELDVRKKTGSSFGTITYLRWATRSNLVPVVEMLMKHGKGSFSEEELDQCRDMAKISGLTEVERVLQNGFA